MVATYVEIRMTPYIGLGVFAARNIPENTAILHETPLFSFPHVDDLGFQEQITTFCDFISALSHDDRYKLARLSFSDAYMDEDLIQNFLVWYDASPRITSRAETVLYYFKLWAKLCTNGIRLGDQGTIVLFPVYSRINHSCDPNANWGTNPNPSARTIDLYVTTTKDIRKGEQIFVSYSGTNVESMTLAERTGLLQDWGFTCKCLRCEQEAGRQPE
ncbi:hypothetical protein M426DRAFT_26372 [Hypoxylon sp. CI-4A]|nr:hypothetical protein M426DRAFT_26372 [Hypoxylon sp. CI-4A]